jgi:hypothetical protein
LVIDIKQLESQLEAHRIREQEQDVRIAELEKANNIRDEDHEARIAELEGSTSIVYDFKFKCGLETMENKYYCANFSQCFAFL